jgi:hypothetical protein
MQMLVKLQGGRLLPSRTVYRQQIDDDDMHLNPEAGMLQTSIDNAFWWRREAADRSLLIPTCLAVVQL